MIYLDKHYNTHQGSQCIISCFYNYFRYSNASVDECDIFFLGEGFSTTYRRKKDGNSYELDVKTKADKSVLKFCELNGIVLVNEKGIEDDYAQKVMIDSIKKGKMIIVKVDASSLDYNPISKSSRGLVHCINAIGINDECTKVFVSDGYVPASRALIYNDWYDIEKLNEGRKPRKNEYIIIEKESLSDFNTTYAKNDINERLRYKVKESLSQYLDGYVEEGIYYGNLALNEFRKDVLNLLEYFGDDFESKMYKTSVKLSIWGFLTNKILLYKAVSKIMRESTYDLYSEQLFDLHKKWNMLNIFMFKTCFSKKQKDLDSISNKIHEMVIEEEELYTKLMKLL